MRTPLAAVQEGDVAEVGQPGQGQVSDQELLISGPSRMFLRMRGRRRGGFRAWWTGRRRLTRRRRGPEGETAPYCWRG